MAFAKEHNIDHDVCGKIVVATDESELVNLERIYQTGIENKIEGLRKIDLEEIKEIEPFCEGIAGLHVPCTGIVDFRGATAKMVELALAINPNSTLKLEHEVTGIVNGEKESIIQTSKGDFTSAKLVFALDFRQTEWQRNRG